MSHGSWIMSHVTRTCWGLRVWGLAIGIVVFELNLTPTQAHTEFYKHGCMIESRGTRENSFNGGVGEGGREGGLVAGMLQ